MQNNSKHIKSLDGLRGCAALAVTMFHGLLHFNTSLIDRVLYAPAAAIHGKLDWVEKILLAIFNGDSAVILFFVLSGYVLAASLGRSLDKSTCAGCTSIEFIVRRLGRIYPALFACMALYWAFSLAFTGGKIVYPAMNAAIAWRSATLLDITVHGPSWSLLVEVLAAPFVLAAVLLCRRFGLFALALLACYAMFCIDYPVLIGSLPNMWPYLISFMIGVGIASPQLQSVRFEPKPLHLALALLAFMFARQVVPRAGVSGLIAQSFLAGLVVFTTVRISTGRIYSFLVSRPVQFMGRISYSFYLINVVFLYLVWGLISAYAVTPEKHYLRWGIISGVVTSVVTIPFATLSERYVERVGARTTAQLIAWIKSFRDLRSRSVQP